MPKRHLQLDVSTQSVALQRGTITASGLTDATLDQISVLNPRLNAFLHVDAEGASAAARASDERLARGRPLSALDGITVAVTDNIDVAGMPTTAGMTTRRGRVAQRDAFVVRRLRDAGAVIVGKLNMQEAALGNSTDNPFYGRCEHPTHAGHSPGGSSGGSACAVAAQLCALALGTDTLGSVRIPAAYCGVVGFKATRGQISNGGMVGCGDVLDHVGPIVRSLADLRTVLPQLVAYDAGHWLSQRTSTRQALSHPRLLAARDLDQLGVADEVIAAYRSALDRLRDRGHNVVETSLGGFDFARARSAGLLIVQTRLLLEHADDWREQPQHFSPELTQWLRDAEGQSALALAQAERVVQAAHLEAARWFQIADVMVLPTAPQTAPRWGEPTPDGAADLAIIANLAGLPALSAPLPRPEGALPIGLQFIAPMNGDATLLALDLRGVVAA